MSAPGSRTTYAVSFRKAMAEIDPVEWNALALPAATPFLEWEWLHLLETSGSVGTQTGWYPVHVLVRDGERLAACAPLYVKGHGEGEFVFDHLWGEVARRMGLPYYPKLVGASPFTPATGYRFLIAPDQDERRLCMVIMEALEKLCAANNLSGISFLFVEPRFAAILRDLGMHSWLHQGYIWENPGYRTFDDYLARFGSQARKNVKRERRILREQGIRVELRAGPDIPAHLFSDMHRFYAATNDKFGDYGCRYLTEEFFDALPDMPRNRLAFVAAYQGDDPSPMAMAMLVRKGDRLNGRYWGATRHVDYLHFELCYYTPITWAIEQGIRLYDPGMGGEHKARRGFVSIPTVSLHRYRDPRFEHVFLGNLGEINALEQDYISELNALLPFRRGPGAARRG
jgi:predicted N-acyltransferase